MRLLILLIVLSIATPAVASGPCPGGKCAVKAVVKAPVKVTKKTIRRPFR